MDATELSLHSRALDSATTTLREKLQAQTNKKVESIRVRGQKKERETKGIATMR